MRRPGRGQAGDRRRPGSVSRAKEDSSPHCESHAAARGQWPLCALSTALLPLPPRQDRAVCPGPCEPACLFPLRILRHRVGTEPSGTQHSSAREEPAQSAGWVTPVTCCVALTLPGLTEPCEGDSPPQVTRGNWGTAGHGHRNVQSHTVRKEQSQDHCVLPRAA